MSAESDEKALQTAATEVIELVKANRPVEAVEKLIGFRARGSITRDQLIRTIISTGQHTQSGPLTRVALKAFERIKKSAKLTPDYYYDVANGYQILYEQGAGNRGENAFEMGEEANSAIKYFDRAATDPRARTNLGNLLDSLARPLEALRTYKAALAMDADFGMAWGNYGMAIEFLTSSGQYPGGLLIMAYHYLQEALDRPTSVIEIGGQEALQSFLAVQQKIEAHFGKDQAQLLDIDLQHDPWDSTGESEFVRFYTELSLEKDLYLNLHLMDSRAAASVGDSFLPTYVSSVDAADTEYRELAFRLNEIHETFASARYLYARSQFPHGDTREISEQTTLINTLDYAASNLYVGLLKASYKEAFSTLDKLAVLINHYLKIGHNEDSVYYGSVWFEPTSTDSLRVVAEPVKAAGYRLFGTYLLCLELRGSRYSSLRNAMTHRYVRVFRGGPVPKGGYDFESLSDQTAEVLFKVKCAVIYASQFIGASERRKYTDHTASTLPAWTNQNLDLWE